MREQMKCPLCKKDFGEVIYYAGSDLPDGYICLPCCVGVMVTGKRPPRGTPFHIFAEGDG